MQTLRGLYSNEVIRTVLTIALFCMNCAVVGVMIRFLHRKIRLLRWLTFTATFAVMGYIAASAVLFTADGFGVRKALLLELIGALAFFAVLALRGKRNGTLVFGELDPDLRPHLIPLVLVIAGLFLSIGNNGYFGMGQDQGVYQVKAINLMYGETGRVYHFDEYDRLENEEEKERLYSTLVNKVLGLDMIDATAEENQVLSALRTGGNAGHEHTDGIFHGIPTYPALLALWGTMAGLENMCGIQTVLYLLTIMTLWFVAENLKLKKSVSALICLLMMLSPEAVWISKSTLTEGLLALIMTRFLFDLTDTEHPERRWCSAWMAVMFALVHVSVFVIVFMFFLLYFLLWLRNGEKQYARALMVSAFGFIGGLTFMTLTAPRYTIRNTAMLWTGPVRLDNVYWIFMGVGLLGVLLSVVLMRVRVRGRFRGFLQGKAGPWCLRAVILLLLGISLFLTFRRIGDRGFEQAVVTNGLYNMIWMTGVIFLPVTLLSLIRKPEHVLREDVTLGITVLFGFAVLLMCCALKSDIAYCYYFGRYLTPYIPVACVMTGLVWNRFSRRSVLACAAAGALMLSPFDMAMLWRQDDTNTSFEALTRMKEVIRPDRSAVIVENAPLLLIPLKTMTGNDCYLMDEDPDEQAERLSETYGNVYCVTGRNLDWDPLTKLRETCYMDDNRSCRLPFCPFPLTFLRISVTDYTVYEYPPGGVW